MGLMSYTAYKLRSFRNPHFRLKEGKGPGNEALINWVTLPHDWREKCKQAFGDPELAAIPTLLEKHYHRDPKAADFYANWKRPDDRNLDYNLIQEYTTNASVLNAVIATMANRRALRKALGGSTAGVWETIYRDIEAMRPRVGHTLKVPSLKRTLANYKKDGYEALISGKLGNRNTAKIKDEKQQALLEELLKYNKNLDNEQIMGLYNIAAEKIGWPTISASTVANKRRDLGLYIEAGRRGLSSFINKKSMQVKRSAPTKPLYYWTLDGWDVELLYQQTGLDSKGHQVTTYTNRLNAVVVLDPNVKYPIGYAIGTHETPALIREALRNAVNHTRELFGQRYKPWQLQSDRYGIKKLTPLYEALSEYFTPAAARLARSKRVEPYFKELNKSIQMMPNWSGYGVTVDPDKQPNAEYLNKIRHMFPDEAGCRAQIVHMLEMKRMELRDKLLANWEQTPEADRLVCDDAEYLNLFGATTGFTNRLHHYGLQVTIGGEELVYDSFDVRFRELSHVNWCVKYDPDDLSKVLVVDAKASGNKLVEELNTMQFVLEQKYVQPMALKDRKEGDAEELARVRDFNKQLKDNIVERGAQNYEVLNPILSRPELEGTLTKLLLVDSMGQYKDNKSQARLAGAKAKQLAERNERREQAKAERMAEREELSAKEEYLDGKMDFNEYF